MEERLDELEIKVAYQDDTLAQLNEVIIRQQRELDRLKQALLEMREQVQGLSATVARKPEDELPPHY